MRIFKIKVVFSGPGVYVHFAALRIQRAWRISRWRRAFALYAEHQAAAKELEGLNPGTLLRGVQRRVRVQH